MQLKLIIFGRLAPILDGLSAL